MRAIFYAETPPIDDEIVWPRDYAEYLQDQKSEEDDPEFPGETE